MTPKPLLKRIIQLMRLKPGDKLYDLGSGDGRVLIEAALSENIVAIGYEVSPIFTYIYRVKNWFSPKRIGKVKVITDTFFKADLSDADHIYCSLNSKAIHALLPLVKKCKNESARLYTHNHKLHLNVPVQVEVIDESHTIYVYNIRDLQNH